MDATRRGVVEGLVVYSSDGEKMGKVIRCGGTAFEIEKGFLFPKDYLISYVDVAKVENDVVRLSRTKAQLQANWERADLIGDRAEDVAAKAPIGYTTAKDVRRSEEEALREQRQAAQAEAHAERVAIQSSAPSDTFRDVVPAQSKFQHERQGEPAHEEPPISHRDFREREAGVYAGGEPKDPLNVGTITEALDEEIDVDEVQTTDDLSKPQVNKDDDFRFE